MNEAKKKRQREMPQLHIILGSISFASGIIGTGGLAGAIEYGTGWPASGLLLTTAVICGHKALKEGGYIKREWNGRKKEI